MRPSAAEWAANVTANLVGAANAARAVLPAMLAAGRGTIVNLSSGAAHIPIAGWGAYCAAKAGLAMLTKTLAAEYGEKGIRVFGFAPGLVDTAMQEAIRAAGIGPVAKLPREKLTSPREPAEAIAFLVSQRGRPLRRPGARHPQRGFPRRRRPRAAGRVGRVRPMRRDEIADVRAFLVDARGAGGDYHDRDKGHWLIDTLIANPMSGYPEYKASRTSWGIAVLGSIVVEIETKGGKIGVATGLGGPPACFMIEKHFRRFLVGADPRDINRIWDQIYRASMPYGRKGITVAALSVVDLALWDLLGVLRDEPVYALIGGATRDAISLYCTGPRPELYKEQGFWGGKGSAAARPGATGRQG